MDLSMILSPVVEEEKPAPPASSREPHCKWSSDELQSAVAILQEFQQPALNATVTQAWSDANAAAAAAAPLDGQGPEQPSATIVYVEDHRSKLDLLVQADALIKRNSPTASALVGHSPTCVRSGVWSRAEEEYAAALVSFFLKGLLNVPEGVTLRKVLAEQLCCNRRRVSMKLGTESLAGQRIPKKVGAAVFVPANPPPSDHVRREAERVLAELRVVNFSSRVPNSRVHDDKREYPLFKCEEKYDKGDKEEEDPGAVQPCKGVRGQKRSSALYNLTAKRCKPTIIRTGFESTEEEEFVTTMFEYFIAGSLDIPDGTKLVAYLCHQLGCTPKQLSMKLAPQRMGERKFPGNVGAITYARKVVRAHNLSLNSAEDKDLSDDFFEVESRITELRLVYEEAHKHAPSQVATPVKRERKFGTTSVSSPEIATLVSTPSGSPTHAFRRSGPWSHDEEVYAAALIDSFFKGVLDVVEGTTLRAFLSSRLGCNPMRISKKLASESIAAIPIPKKLGSLMYVRNVEKTPEDRSRAEDALYSLRCGSMNKRAGAKCQRQSRVRCPRRLVGAWNTESNLTESLPTGAGRGKRIEQSKKTAKQHYSARDEQMQQRFNVPNIGPDLVVPPA